ncbi:hypothetical protein [Sandarakinorhabdus sp.]|uniref:hypothetical protein n=1 Tax=Sandarakinorhabdus sp. TaxID=1916663 RepID=UPI00286E1ED7|nr:hypothetical protein [Sandarakinorhabdus sp.]
MITDTLITDQVWANAPSDAEEAFLFIALAAYNQLKLLTGDETLRGQHGLVAWRQQYVYEVCTVADALGISGLPDPGRAVQTTAAMADFDTHLARVITKIKAVKRAELRDDSVLLSYQTKEDIRKHLEELRAKINSSNLSDTARAALHKKIDAVEAEIDHQRSSLRSFWLLAGAMATAGCMTVSTINDMPGAIKTVNVIIDLVHQDKAAQEAHELHRNKPPMIEYKKTLQIAHKQD